MAQRGCVGLKRWDARGDVPGVTKEELSEMKLK
jgi:hypothetical protein